MIDEEVLADVAETVDSTDFYTKQHATIFGAMMRLYEKHKPVDLLTLSDELKRKDELDIVGGSAYLSELTEYVPTAAHAASALVKRCTASSRVAGDARSCRTAAWRFTATSLATPAGSQCRFSRVTEVPGGYDIQATCTAEAPPTSDTLRIRFAESADGMLFESDSIADAGLIYCGPPE